MEFNHEVADRYRFLAGTAFTFQKEITEKRYVFIPGEHMTALGTVRTRFDDALTARIAMNDDIVETADQGTEDDEE